MLISEVIKKADVLIEALPYIRQFKGKVVVIKYGGRALLNKGVRKNILSDIAFMATVGIKPLLVHGGGASITERIRKKGKLTWFIEGKRVTDSQALKVVYEVLKEINSSLIAELSEYGVSALAIDAKQDHIIRAKPLDPKLGYVGEVASLDVKYLKNILRKAIIPVVMPLGIGPGHKLYNINADDAASQMASFLRAEKLIFLTDVRGILRERENENSLISTLHASEVEELKRIGVISGGMIPKVNACISALEAGVKKTHIINGRIPHALLLEVFTTEGIGTEILI